MKTFKKLQEDRGEKAFKQAIQMGLKYAGFGYWKDPQTGETKYKTENDTLVKVEPREESELAAKGGPDGGAGRPDPMAGGAPMGGEFDGAMAAMDGAASANMAEGMEAANTAADAADAAAADAPADDAPTDDVV